MSDKLCIFCKHFNLDTGERGYSDLTPGYDFRMSCGKNVWKFSLGDSEEHYRFCIIAARTCDKYEPREDGQ